MDGNQCRRALGRAGTVLSVAPFARTVDPSSQPQRECVINHFDLVAAARRVAVENGFDPDFGPDVQRELAQTPSAGAAPATTDGARDLRGLLWSSIDNDESLDLDQIEVAEQLPDGSIRVTVGIADVDVLVPGGSPIDGHAAHNATSVYSGVTVFPMLPEALSTGKTSLLGAQDRLAIAIEVVVDKDGNVTKYDAYRAVVRNKAKLAYDSVGQWLEGEEGGGSGSGAKASAPPAIADVAGLEDQLRLQREAARRLKAQRDAAGALELDTIEARPVAKDGRIVDLALTRKNLARDLIEDFMIAANVAIAKFLEAHGSSGIRRVVREPERWARIVELAQRYGTTLPSEPDPVALSKFLAARRVADPLRFPDLSLSVVKLLGPGEYALDRPGKDPGGHFGLAAHDYTHATAPNRRYADLVTQRLVKAVLAGAQQPYSDDELTQIAAHCTEREDAARKVERTVRKIAAALLLGDRIGQSFDGIVTGNNQNGVFVRLLSPPAEGRLVHGDTGVDVGDRVRVRLVHVNPDKGFIDFHVLNVEGHAPDGKAHGGNASNGHTPNGGAASR